MTLLRLCVRFLIPNTIRSALLCIVSFLVRMMLHRLEHLSSFARVLLLDADLSTVFEEGVGHPQAGEREEGGDGCGPLHAEILIHVRGAVKSDAQSQLSRSG